jgi:glycosyltransferase involved in cell wall biosynthesis
MGERVVYEIAKRLKEKNFEIKVLTTGNPDIKEFENISTIRLPIHRYFMNLAVPWIYKHAKDVDLIQTNNYNACFPSFLAGKLLNKPVVCLVHGMYGNRWFKIRGKFLGTLSMFVENFQIKHNYDKIIFLSDFARDVGLNLGISEKLTRVIKPGIEYEKYKMGQKEPFVLFVGRLSMQKGLDYLIETAKELPKIKFVIVGSGEQEKRLKSIAPNNVEFLGFVSEEKLIDLYSRALIFCLPSIGETFGFVQLEAMASGCAIVSTTPLDYCGKKVDIGNSEQIKKAIDYLINNPSVSIKMGKINREKAKEYNWDNFIENLIEIYEDVLH